MNIEWKKKDHRLLVGKMNGKIICEISQSRNGWWLDWKDRKELPIICGSIDEAKFFAETADLFCEGWGKENNE